MCKGLLRVVLNSVIIHFFFANKIFDCILREMFFNNFYIIKIKTDQSNY
jgi:hypothetical protein